jgi:hypothetical protein
MSDRRIIVLMEIPLFRDLYFPQSQPHRVFIRARPQISRLIYSQGVPVLCQQGTESTIKRTTGYCAHTGVLDVRRYMTGA